MNPLQVCSCCGDAGKVEGYGTCPLCEGLGIAAWASTLDSEADGQSEAGSDVQPARTLDGTLVILERNSTTADGGCKGSDWRLREVLGASTSSMELECTDEAPSGAAAAGVLPLPPRPAGQRPRGEDWRRKEVFAASAAFELDESGKPAPSSPSRSSPKAAHRAEKAAKRGGRRRSHVKTQASLEAVLEDCGGSDWRMMEVAGASAEWNLSPRASSAKRSGGRMGAASAALQGDDWRELELLGASSVSHDSPRKQREADPSPAAAQMPPPPAGVPGAEAEQPQEGPEDAAEQPQRGDVVILGPGAPPEYRQCPGVVMKVFDSHCTVIVLDETRRLGIGECWPSFWDITIDSSWLRLGSRVVIDGLQSSRAKKLNGFRGKVAEHPSKGHPTFVSKPSAPERPQFTICVALDDPEAAGEKSVLLEPRFLVPYTAFEKKATKDLSQALASLCTASMLVAATDGGTCAAAARPVPSGYPCAAVPT